ncbi:hypothetical protein [Methylobacterium sp. 391_Methyba4]|uniref:hypothetical protein n=1 Tax=Methylobacterium sp. 391_Methyba4 TaxID=3038924 RepID=UPI00241F6E65|nr:hypothetical protein [Methylobacterium sp. 391_Methyba4]WFS09661.1 hypothetical protein P9K36_10410 [Methylobacterium sp. 391_Methyba4]
MVDIPNERDPRFPAILSDEHHQAASAFTPESLLREARRQKNVAEVPIPDLCVLDPDGDIVRHLRATPGPRATAWHEAFLSVPGKFRAMPEDTEFFRSQT